MRRTNAFMIVVALASCLSLGSASAAEGPAPSAPSAPAPSAPAPSVGGHGAAASESPADESAPGQSLGDILKAGGVIGMLIMLLSVAAVALVIEHVMTIRASVLMPPGLGEEVYDLLAAGKVGPADQRCQMQPSFLAHVLGAGLAEVDGGWPAVEKAVEDATAEQSARLFRKIEYLSVIGNIAPMMGLLGTVIGMIFAFREVADTQGAARAADLAEGIYLALVTTVEGLIVAIPSLAAFAVFRNRVDHLVAEVTYVAQHVFAPLKRNRTAGPPKAPAPPKAPPQGPSPPRGGGGS
ncbi:MAG TPA: MotA/TolQ/ExbB proton channel family protein [Thermoguttaceae bacterium]|nr:MotA/TolQ/ExbB proton channel family protein [Thermoguttaceae bacterium]